MTDRICLLTVCLERDIREDDAQPLIDAIMMLKGVLRVETKVSDPTIWVAEQRALRALGDKVVNAVYPEGGKSE
jgi:hypothetical protein